MGAKRILHLPRRSFPAIALAVVAVLAWVAGCADGSPGPDLTSQSLASGLIISNPLSVAAPSAQASAATAGSIGSDFVYVALTPGTATGGTTALVRRVGDASSVATAVQDGGFDPVPVIAQTGDSVDVTVIGTNGDTLYHVGAVIAASRPPIVVRTEPPPKKRDVPLNASLVIVFSEPVKPSTLNPSSVQLRRGSTSVGGSVGLLQGTATSAVFTPATPLDPSNDYRLTVTREVRDLQGEPLVAADTVDFTTGSTTVGTVASVSLGLNDTATVVPLGSQFQLTATARDAQGLEVVGQPVAWSSSNPSVVPVSPTGLVTAVAQGTGTISATVQGQSGRAPFVVTATLVPVASVTVTPESGTVLVAGVLPLKAEVGDANGLATHRLVTWSSSNPAVATVTGAGESGLVTGVSEGTTRIAATVEGKSDTAIVTVQSVGAIAFASDRDGCRNIYSMNPDGSNVAALTNCLNVFDRGGESPAWSPDGQKIAYALNSRLYVVNAGGSQRREVIPSDPTVFGLSQPAWSPDGTKLAAHADFGTCGLYCNGIIVMNVDGTVLFHIGVAVRSAGAQQPAWSPDGRIAYTKLGDIYVRDADSSITNLTNTQGTNRGPAWSPDGTKIAFVSNRGGDYDLYVMNADGTGVTPLNVGSVSYDIRPAWSPDGTKIVFGNFGNGYSIGEIYVMNADGSGVTRLTNNTWYDGGPAWRR
ncbi:MAG TPA: Ig-like domain-containing protein [Gemmatimonadales bacterium]